VGQFIQRDFDVASPSNISTENPSFIKAAAMPVRP